MSKEYGLYQTLSSSPHPQRQLTKAQHASLQKKMIDSTFDLTSKKACVLLICEHSRLEGGFEYNPEGNQSLPYGIVTKENGDIDIDIGALPLKLKHVLLKFFEVLEKKDA